MEWGIYSSHTCKNQCSGQKTTRQDKMRRRHSHVCAVWECRPQKDKLFVDRLHASVSCILCLLSFCCSCFFRNAFCAWSLALTLVWLIVPSYRIWPVVFSSSMMSRQPSSWSSVWSNVQSWMNSILHWMVKASWSGWRHYRYYWRINSVTCINTCIRYWNLILVKSFKFGYHDSSYNIYLSERFYVS